MVGGDNSGTVPMTLDNGGSGGVDSISDNHHHGVVEDDTSKNENKTNNADADDDHDTANHTSSSSSSYSAAMNSNKRRRTNEDGSSRSEDLTLDGDGEGNGNGNGDGDDVNKNDTIEADEDDKNNGSAQTQTVDTSGTTYKESKDKEIDVTTAPAETSSSSGPNSVKTMMKKKMVMMMKPKVVDVPWGPVFFPTVEDMEGSPLTYLEKIRPVAERYGIAKIVPPDGWSTNFFALTEEQMEVDKQFSTKKQYLHRIQEGISFGDGEEYNPASYQRYASKFTKEYKDKHYPDPRPQQRRRTDDDEGSGGGDGGGDDGHGSEDGPYYDFCPENLEQDYWDIVENRSGREVVVEYGNDVDTNEFGSGFPLSERGRSTTANTNTTNESETRRRGGPDDANQKQDLPEPKFGTDEYYKETWWNLNNMPNTPDSVLRHVKVGINGINVPWMYYGSLFTTFCWHNEDNYLYSINYHHKGAPKQWYGVPGTQKDADGLEKVFKSYLSSKMRDIPDLLHHITTQFSPRLLQNANVPIYKLLQHEGEYVVTFPRAFHGGFSYGPNVGEAVNFATHDWILHGSDANERYRSFARPAVFSHDRLTFTMAHHVSEQKSYRNCKLLLEELDRVVAEELLSRERLIDAGVRDVSHLIQLPPNYLEQLDEYSAEYDDKRLCHACKHVCFNSAIACECSQSKVSCLRHSHYMCRCPIERRYLMIWSPKDELQRITQKVRERCQELAQLEDIIAEDGNSSSTERRAKPDSTSNLPPLPPVAVGVQQDLEAHKDDKINTDQYRPSLQDVSSVISTGLDSDDVKINHHQQVLTSDEDRDEATTEDGGSIDKGDY